MSRDDGRKLAAFFGKAPVRTVNEVRPNNTDDYTLRPRALGVVDDHWRRQVYNAMFVRRCHLVTSGGCWLRLGIEIARGYAGIAIDQIRIEQERIKAGLTPLTLQFEIQGGLAEARAYIDGLPAEDKAWLGTVAYMVDELALADYKLRFPKARGDKAWIYKGHIRGGGNIHCRFCDEILHARAAMRVDYGTDPKLRNHVRICALESLAGIRNLAGPKPPARHARVHVISARGGHVRGHVVEQCEPEGLGPDGAPLCMVRKTSRFHVAGAPPLSTISASMLDDNAIYWIDLVSGFCFEDGPTPPATTTATRTEQKGTTP